jgi:hypothetical protein
MTSLQLLYLASAFGAALFFAAGAMAAAMRARAQPAFAAAPMAMAAPPNEPIEPVTVPRAQPRTMFTDVSAETRALEQALEQARTAVAAAERDRDAHERRVRESEARAAEQAKTLRDLATEGERLRGRLADADALRSDYVRLRTITTDSDFLRSEVTRLQKELHEIRQHALGARPRPQPRAIKPIKPSTTPRGSIGESLISALTHFSDDHTRACAVADPLGFPLAATGDDGLALAAYGALLLEAATRASQFLPVARPASVEVIDERGARIAAYTFDVDADRLVLVNLGVDVVDGGRLGTALAELANILTPSARSATS